MAATPLVLCDPTMARLAMRILRRTLSSTRLTRSISSFSREAGPDRVEHDG